MRIIKKHNIEIINKKFEIDCKIIFAVSKNKKDVIIDAFKREHSFKVKYIKDL